MLHFRDRHDAGRRLAEQLNAYTGREDVLVMGLPRGGIPVAYEVAARLEVPLDAYLVRKLGVPGQEELAFGAVAVGGVRVLNQDVVQACRISLTTIDRVEAREQRELDRRDALYRDARPFPSISGRTIILVDDGLATGATMRAAVLSLRRQQPACIVVAVPVAALSTCMTFTSLVDDLIATSTPEPFYAVGMAYEDFTPTTDYEVRALLDAARKSDWHVP